MPALPQCSILGTIYDSAGELAPDGFKVKVLQATKNGEVISDADLTYLVEGGAGQVTFDAPRLSTIRVYAEAGDYWRARPDLSVPDAASANLEDLAAASVVPAISGVTVKDEGIGFANLVSTFDFVGAGVDAIEDSAGHCTISIPGGSGATIEDVDGVPSFSTVGTLRFASADGFVLTQPALGEVQINLTLTKVSGPASSTDNAIARFDGTTGQLIQNGVITIDDTGLITFPNGVRQTFNPGGTTPGLNVGAIGGDPNTPINGDIWYDSTNDQLNARINGSTINIGAGTVTNVANLATGQLVVGASGSTINVSNLSGDVTTAGGTATTIANDAVTYAKMQNVSAGSKLLGRGSASGAGDVEEITLGSGLTLTGTTLTASGAIGGSDTQVQFNDSGAFGGDPGLTYNKITNVLTIASGGLVLATSGTITQTSASATAFESGPNGSTNPVFRLVNSTASQASGISVTGKADGTAPEILSLSRTAQASAIAGNGLSISADPAIAGSSNAGAAAGGSVTITAGTAARLTSGNAAGGSINLVLGAGIGTGNQGQIVISNNGVVAAPQIAFSGSLTTGIRFNSAGDASGIYMVTGGTDTLRLGSGVTLHNLGKVGWSSGGSATFTADTAFSRNAAAVVEINNGTSSQWGALLCGTRDAGTTTVANALTLGHQSTGTPAAGLGTGILFNINSSTTADQAAGRIHALWTTATHASRTADLVFEAVNNAAALAEVFRIKANGLPVHPTTTTAGGVTGNQTIDKPTGSVNFAAGTSTLTVTNALVSATTLVFAAVLTNDTTAQVKNVVAAAGSFVITLVANATAETKVGWAVMNT